MSVLRAQPLASTAAAQRRPARTNRASQRPRGSTQIAGSSQQSGGVRWPPVVADTQAEVRSGEGKGGGSPACAGRCASLWAVRWKKKEGAVAAVRRAWHRASWAAAMGTLLGTRRSRGWRMGGTAAGETGARIGGTMAARSGAHAPSAPTEPEPEQAAGPLRRPVLRQRPRRWLDIGAGRGRRRCGRAWRRRHGVLGLPTPRKCLLAWLRIGVRHPNPSSEHYRGGHMAMPFFNGEFMPLNVYHCTIPR